jgi:Glycosyl transferase family 2
MTSDTEKFLVFAAMRNEGAFIVEWVSWYRMLGFKVLIGTNDCTDHSVDLLDALARAGWLSHFSHDPGASPAKQSAHRHMRQQPQIAATDWLLICDVDEFLVVHAGDGTVNALLDTIGRDFLGVALHWQCFGTGGHATYADGLVHQQFLRRGTARNGVNRNFKSLFKHPLRYKRYSDHGPFMFDGVWGEGSNHFVNAEGKVIPRFLTAKHPVRISDLDDITTINAQMNHYVIRSDESFDLKRGTPSASAHLDRYTNEFYRARNRNGIIDRSALRYADQFAPIHAAAMTLPDVARLHHLCCADYVVRLCAKKGTDHRTDPRWLDHMERAAEGSRTDDIEQG